MFGLRLALPVSLSAASLGGQCHTCVCHDIMGVSIFHMYMSPSLRLSTKVLTTPKSNILNLP